MPVRSIFLPFLALALGLAACGEGNATDTGNKALSITIDDFCNRMDECDLLEDISASECTDDINVCLDTLLASDADNWQTDIESCLDESSCTGMWDCYWTVPGC